MDYSHYMYLRKEVDLERIMSREDARSPALHVCNYLRHEMSIIPV